MIPINHYQTASIRRLNVFIQIPNVLTLPEGLARKLQRNPTGILSPKQCKVDFMEVGLITEVAKHFNMRNRKQPPRSRTWPGAICQVVLFLDAGLALTALTWFPLVERKQFHRTSALDKGTLQSGGIKIKARCCVIMSEHRPIMNTVSVTDTTCPPFPANMSHRCSITKPVSSSLFLDKI